MSSGTVEIMLVEDNPADARLTQEALRETKVVNEVTVCVTAEDALAYLRTAGVKIPDLILLDLNLPGMDGREFLEEVKKDRDLCRIPVCVLTTSKSEEDILRAYELQASCYVVKPVDLSQFITVVQHIENFWFSVVKLPPKDESA